MRLTIVGGGGFRAPLIYRELVRRRSPIGEVVLYDVDASRLDVIESVLAPDRAADWAPRLRTTTSLDAAVTGADFVFVAIRVGGVDGRVADERRAQSLGLLGQETTGAGGIAYGLRTVPVALSIAAEVASAAPNAWIINFTNPAGMITEAMRSVVGDRVIGICDTPIGLVRRVSRILGFSSAARPDYVGINHLGWLRHLELEGRDRLPEAITHWDSFEEGRLFGHDLLRSLRAIPNEYCYFYYSRTPVASGPTRGEFIRDEQTEFYSAAMASPDKAPSFWSQTRRRREETYFAEARSSKRDEEDLAGGGYEEVALDVMSALADEGNRELIVNVANGVTLPELPSDMVIEVPSTVSAAGAAPLPTGPLDLHQLGLIASVRSAERSVISAVLSGSRDLALQAFATHPLVGDLGLARKLLEDTLAATPSLGKLLR